MPAERQPRAMRIMPGQVYGLSESIRSSLHQVADRPYAFTLAEAEALIDLAAQCQSAMRYLATEPAVDLKQALLHGQEAVRRAITAGKLKS